jgi:ATP-dependent Clp protease ATP-binding subunit ClpX
MAGCVMEINKEEPVTRYCYFCGASEHEVRQLVGSSPNVYICDQCVCACVDIITEKTGREFVPMVKKQVIVKSHFSEDV